MPTNSGEAEHPECAELSPARQAASSASSPPDRSVFTVLRGGARRPTPPNSPLTVHELTRDRQSSWSFKRVTGEATLTALEQMNELKQNRVGREGAETSPASPPRQGESMPEQLRGLKQLKLIDTPEQAAEVDRLTAAVDEPNGTVTVLVAVMPKKLYSKPMFAILRRLVLHTELNVVALGEHMLLKQPAALWFVVSVSPSSFELTCRLHVSIHSKFHV